MDHNMKKLIEEGEGQQLDFKYCVSDSRKIARTLSAFSNSDGGRLLIGVRDNGSIAGIKSDEEISEQLQIKVCWSYGQKPTKIHRSQQKHSDDRKKRPKTAYHPSGRHPQPDLCAARVSVSYPVP